MTQKENEMNTMNTEQEEELRIEDTTREGVKLIMDLTQEEVQKINDIAIEGIQKINDIAQEEIQKLEDVACYKKRDDDAPDQLTCAELKEYLIGWLSVLPKQEVVDGVARMICDNDPEFEGNNVESFVRDCGYDTYVGPGGYVLWKWGDGDYRKLPTSKKLE